MPSSRYFPMVASKKPLTQGWDRVVRETFVEAGVHLVHVLVDDLQGEVRLALEVVIEGPLRDAGGGQDPLDTQVGVAVLEEEPFSQVQQALLGFMHGESPE